VPTTPRAIGKTAYLLVFNDIILSPRTGNPIGSGATVNLNLEPVKKSDALEANGPPRLRELAVLTDRFLKKGQYINRLHACNQTLVVVKISDSVTAAGTPAADHALRRSCRGDKPNRMRYR
jgi:hypothetical protein